MNAQSLSSGEHDIWTSELDVLTSIIPLLSHWASKHTSVKASYCPRQASLRGGRGKEGWQGQKGVSKRGGKGKDKPPEGQQRQRHSSLALELWLLAYTPGLGPLPQFPSAPSWSLHNQPDCTANHECRWDGKEGGGGAEGDLPVHSTVLHSHRIHPSRNARLTMCLAKDHVMLSVWESVKSKRLHVNNARCCGQTAVNRQDAHTLDRLTCCVDSNTALSLA